MLIIYLVVAGIIALMDMINLGVIKPSRILGSLFWPISVPVLIYFIITSKGNNNG